MAKGGNDEVRLVKKRRGMGPVIGPRLKKLLAMVFGLFALLGVNSLYLASVTLLEWYTKNTFQGYFYQYMYLIHLIMGVAIILPVLVFGILHMRKAHDHRNRRAVRVGYALFFIALILLLSGIVLTRLDFFEVKDPVSRSTAYYAHLICPLLVAWLFVLHRLAGKRIRWRVGGIWAIVAVVFAAILLFFQAQDPRKWNVEGPASGEKYFFPSLARTASGNFIPAETLMMDQYCIDCHSDIHAKWSNSAHRFSSFSNPAYLFSVRETRAAMLKRDGNVAGSRFCAGCHDLVPFFSGLFDDPNFDDENHPTAGVGITCTSCHAITHINSSRGNADYTIEEPIHYPFAFSHNRLLKWVNHQLVKGKPAFHKKTFLKPLHRTAEFCGTCHKVHLGREINAYKWIRGQNHYDSFLLSGVSGHGVQSFYYPPKAEENCNGCHMKPLASNDFGARYLDDSGSLKVHDHQFPSANTAIVHLMKLAESANDAHREMLRDSLRVDIFAIKEGGAIDAPVVGPIRPLIPALTAGKTYLLEAVVRTLTLGHHFSQGTADSNEIWLEVTVKSGDRILGRGGGMDKRGQVDPWSHFINAYVLDREGNRIDRRNAQDIFVPLYNHQIPPGAADVVHYLFRLPPDVVEPVRVKIALHYRKFDATYMRYIFGEDYINDLPIVTIAEDEVTFPVGREGVRTEPSPIPEWQRWNDYGIGLLRKGNAGSSKGELRQAEHAFGQVTRLNKPDGPLNQARVYLKEGRLEEAAMALRRAAEHDPPARWWSIAWFSGLVDKQNGNLDQALHNFKNIIDNGPREIGFDFSLDYRLLNEYGQTLFERAKMERGEERSQQRRLFLEEAVIWFEKALAVDSENVTSHYNLYLLYQQLGENGKAETHRSLHAKYKPDDNVRDYAVSAHRGKNPAADHAAEAVVIYDLQRKGAFP